MLAPQAPRNGATIGPNAAAVTRLPEGLLFAPQHGTLPLYSE
ncbi:hypothetical protein [Elstera cyanobacteriorum]|nr:hypothetical protein [Elstera cyanobacteriorum]